MKGLKVEGKGGEGGERNALRTLIGLHTYLVASMNMIVAMQLILCVLCVVVQIRVGFP